MAKVVENPNGRRMIRLNIEDVLFIVSEYQRNIIPGVLKYDEAIECLNKREFYLPEEV